jgi:hypothetical protein
MQANGTRTLSGRGLLHRRWDKRQLGCIAANAAEPHTNTIEPSIEAADLEKVAP